MRGLLGSSAADAVLPSSRDTGHNSENCGSNNADVRTTARASPARAEPKPTITRSFLSFGSFIARLIQCFFKCTIARAGRRSLLPDKQAANRQDVALNIKIHWEQAGFTGHRCRAPLCPP